MSIVQRIKCDGCNAEKDWWLEADKRPDHVPAGWISLVESDADPVHFCCYECVLGWVDRRRRVNHRLVPAVAS